jgi:hypothetical protein
MAIARKEPASEGHFLALSALRHLGELHSFTSRSLTAQIES